MGRITDPVLDRFVREFLPRLEKLYRPTLVIAFRSRARGDALEESDLDLVIVSERFRSMRFLNRIFAVDTDLDLPFGADLLCYTPEEFERKRQELGTVSAAVEEGMVLSGELAAL